MTKLKPSEYQSISCAMHSELELAIMHKQHLIIDYMNNADEQIKIKLFPQDIISRHQGEAGEFLLAMNQSDQQVSIRLDKILKFAPL
jgi:transcriptional antiterminator Rof (Rho-off)